MKNQERRFGVYLGIAACASLAATAVRAEAERAARPALLELTAGTEVIENVPVSTGGVLSLPDGRKLQMTTAGAGLRRKRVLGVPLKIYVLQLLVNDPKKFVQTMDGALDSLDAESEVALHLTLKRTVSSAEMVDAFRAGLAANRDALAAKGIPIEGNPDLDAMSAAINAGGDLNEGSAVVFAFFREGQGSETLVYQAPSGEARTIHGRSGFLRAVLSIWLGSPADGQLENLKKQLLHLS
jgi:hypothetical protein